MAAVYRAGERLATPRRMRGGATLQIWLPPRLTKYRPQIRANLALRLHPQPLFDMQEMVVRQRDCSRRIFRAQRFDDRAMFVDRADRLAGGFIDRDHYG